MDWKIFITTFATLFIAEMGDKTQFAALAASAGTKNTTSVLLGVVLGLSLAGGLGVIAGRFIGEAVNPDHLRLFSGGLFIIVGIWVLLSK